MIKITKKQRVALQEISKLMRERKNDYIQAAVSILIMAILIAVYNLLVYQTGTIGEDNVVVRGMLYVTAMVIAGFCGIKIMKAGQKSRKIEGFRQANAISRETLDAWTKGEIQ